MRGSEVADELHGVHSISKNVVYHQTLVISVMRSYIAVYTGMLNNVNNAVQRNRSSRVCDCNTFVH